MSTRAIAELRRAGVAHAVHDYETASPSRDGQRAYGLEAASALGVDPRRIFKTLIADVDGRLAVAIVPVAAELDLKKLATALGRRRATMADPAVAERATGYVLGGISPIGQTRRLPTVLDDSADSFETVFVSAGRRGLQVELAPSDLASVTSASSAAIARSD
ncbi:MAG TPA: Cys-tRNA(Pro) deacylase [Candidatus Limnocylindrales bacterium]|nr:Cys-tRNA(Pro) deacylase [Candidatus Limnocylindrales bacterium]